MPKRRRRTRRIAVGLGLYAVLVVALIGCSNRLFLHPTHEPIEVAAERVVIPGRRRAVADRELEGFRRRFAGDPDQEPAVYILAFTGNAGRAERALGQLVKIVAPLADMPGCPKPQGCRLELLTMNYPGFGRDTEPATLRALQAAALDAYAATKRRAGSQPVLVYGISMGTTAALHIAASTPLDPPDGLIIDRGPDIPAIVLGRFGWWNLWLAAGPVALSLPKGVYSRHNARHAGNVPALFVLATKDTLVTPRNGRRVYGSYAGPKQLVWFEGHHNSALSGTQIQEGLAWLWREAELGPAALGR